MIFGKVQVQFRSRIHNLEFRSLQKVSDPCGSGSGSTTLVETPYFFERGNALLMNECVYVPSWFKAGQMGDITGREYFVHRTTRLPQLHYVILCPAVHIIANTK
jgi:hypothetical protein